MKKNIVIVILLILVIGLAGYIGYDKYIVKEEPTTESNSENTNSEVTETNEEIITNDYEMFSKNLKSQLSKYDANNLNYQYINDGSIKNGYAVYINEKGSLFVTYGDNELNAKYGDYKIADDVLSFYIIETGNGGMSVLYFINSDGTVGSANVEFTGGSTEQIVIKKDLGYKNIVSIVSGSFGRDTSGAQDPIFIDINGNIFSENLK